MDTHQRYLLAAGVVVLSGVVSVLAAPRLPKQVVTHWDAAGRPNGTMPRAVALAFVPVLSALLLGLFALLPRVDPLGRNVAAFRAQYDWFVVLMTAFLFAVHAAVVAFGLGYRVDVTALVVGVAVLFYAVGVLLEHAERNWFVGIRTPWTLSSDAVWERTHALGAKLLKLSALVSLAGLLLGRYAVYVVLASAAVTALVTVAYSYYAYERRGERDSRRSPDRGRRRRPRGGGGRGRKRVAESRNRRRRPRR